MSSLVETSSKEESAPVSSLHQTNAGIYYLNCEAKTVENKKNKPKNKPNIITNLSDFFFLLYSLSFPA